MPDLSKPAPTLDRARLSGVIDPIVRAHGGEVVDMELKTEQGGWVLRIFVEKAGAAEAGLSTAQAAVNLELCTNVARELSPALDEVEVIAHRYHLEVSSPGVERALRGERDFVRFVGKKAKLKLHAGIAGQKVVVGVLGPCQGGALTIVEGPRTHTVPLADVAHARLVFEFGPQPKPGKSKKK